MQLALLPDLERRERPWKVVRKVSRRLYARLRDSGELGKQAHKVLTALAYYRNRRQEWPTAAELATFMHETKRIARPDTRLVAPRLTELLRGKVVRTKPATRSASVAGCSP
jgi:hypothetical protein